MATDNSWLIKMPHARTTGRAVPILTKIEIDEMLQCGYDDVFVGFRVFVLRKKLTNYDNSLVIPGTEWRQHYVIDFKWSVPYYYLYPLDYPTVIEFHPKNSQIVFFKKNPNMFCYDMEGSQMRLVQYVGEVLPFVPLLQPPMAGRLLL